MLQWLWLAGPARIAQPTQPTFAKYSQLPTELRLKVVEAAVTEMGQPAKLAGHAVLDLAWKEVVEKRTFAQVTVDSANIHNFQRICRCKRRIFLKTIYFRVDLGNLVNPHSDAPAPRCKHMASLSSTYLAHSFKSLFQALETWDTNDRPELVELVYSIKWRKARPCQNIVESSYLRRLLEEGLSCDMSGLPKVGVLSGIRFEEEQLASQIPWKDRRRDMFLRLAAVYPRTRRLDTMLQRVSPVVPDPEPINSHDIRERDISLDLRSLASVYQRLPNVAKAEVEIILAYSVRPMSRFCSDDCTESLQSILGPSTSVRTATLRGASKEVVCLHHRSRTGPMFRPTPASTHLTRSIFDSSRHLQRLTLYHIINVEQFFRKSNGRNTSDPWWPDLHTLKIHATFAVNVSPDSAAPDELFDAVTAALPHMPRITSLSIDVFTRDAVQPDLDRYLSGEEQADYNEDLACLPDYLIYLRVRPRLLPADHSLLVLSKFNPSRSQISAWEAAIYMRQRNTPVLKIIRGNFVASPTWPGMVPVTGDEDSDAQTAWSEDSSSEDSSSEDSSSEDSWSEDSSSKNSSFEDSWSKYRCRKWAFWHFAQ